MKVKYTESPCNDDNLHVTISSNYIISKSLSYIIVICHQRFSVEYITKYVCRKKEKLCYYEINENLDICVGLTSLQRISIYTCVCIYDIDI